MPYGLITWVDPTADQAGVRRGSRTFHARLSDVAPPARRVGARVHFDVVRDDGTERAAAVTLRRPGGNGRGGNLVGARSSVAGAAGPATGRHPEYSRSLPQHPLQIVGAWGQHLAFADLDEAVRLYSPDVTVHLDGTSLTSERLIRAHLETVPVFSCAVPPEVRGEKGLVAARWSGIDGGFTVMNRIAHHLIAEQWVSPVQPEEERIFETATGAVTVTTSGDVGPDLVEYAMERVGHLLERVVEPLLAVRIRLEMAGDPARDRPAMAQVQLDVNGRFVGAHVAAPEMREAVDLLQRRLADQLEHRERRFETLRRSRTGQSGPGEWHHGDLPSARPDFFDRPVEERQLVRHKVFLPEGQTLDEAVFDMEQLDYQFFLFHDIDSGTDTLVERPSAPGAPYRVRRVRADAEPPRCSVAVELDGHPAPELDLDLAIEQLNASGLGHVFYADRHRGAGCVVYRRYDGHYGLMVLGD